MNKQEATQFIQQVFQSPFDEQRFGRFAAELLNEIKDKSFIRSGQYIKDAFKQYVRSYRRIGIYTDPNGDEVDVLIVHLRQGTTLERARTMQRNFIAHYLRDGGARDAALVAYYSDDEPDWRFSLVRMAYKRVQDEASGKIKVVEELTPARRYSFLVGETEPSHTAQQQFITLLTEERSNPTLDDLEAAFNLETVTKEFFEKYKGLFLRLYEALDGLVRTNPMVRAEFTAKALDTRHFAKKLLGQIVFLYFLQKKGWLGVQPGAAWGSGPKDFLRRLFDGHWGDYTNFFNERLEPLFYKALARQRPDNLYEPLGCQIPFLNGGLFEPLQGYDWQRVDILLDNELFAAIFATFDLYNFTVRENEPLEKEVAVDPEMLGKVFENLLEVTDRKSKGAFYTPREIVQYMCQESLINYLDTALNLQEVPVVAEAPTQATLFGDAPPHQATLTTWARRERVPREELAKLIRKGEQVKEFEAAKERGTKAYPPQLDEKVRRHAGLLDDALASIKICDPAIGSGAFPVGMMQEIVRAREVLTVYLGDDARNSVSDVTTAYTADRSAYAFKRHAIQESIYGVDIDPGAVDIAKLRLWLSLVVDEEDYRTIKPLPNLDYKIVCGNSLLRTEKTLFNNNLLHTLQERQSAYFIETDPAQKHAQHQEIDTLIEQITGGAFDFEIYFSKIFENQGGFDVVIGNPPYVRQELLTAQKPQLKAAFPKVFAGTADLLVYFYAKGIELLRPHGTLALITSNKFMRAGYGEKLRTHLTSATTLHTVIDFGDLPVFDATAYPCIVLVQKQEPQEEQTFQALNVNEMGVLQRLPQEVDAMAWTLPQKKFNEDKNGWVLSKPKEGILNDKLKRKGLPLRVIVKGQFYRGVVTGADSIFVIDEDTRNNLLELDPRSDEIIKPWLRGKDVQKWSTNWERLYVIFTRRGISINDYPAITDYLRQHKPRLVPGINGGRKPGSYKWYEIQDSTDYYMEIEKPKIVYQKFQVEPKFSIDKGGFFVNSAIWMLVADNPALVGILNSKLGWYLIQNHCTRIQNGYQLIWEYFGNIPIVLGDTEERNLLASLVEQMISLRQSNPLIDLAEYEKQVNTIVYKIYDLTDAEIALVEAQVDR